MSFLDYLRTYYPDYLQNRTPDMDMNDHKIVQILKSLFPDIVDLTYTKSKHDFYLSDSGDGGEIKVRRRHYEDSYGIDKPKYDYLVENNFSYYIVWSPGQRTYKDIVNKIYNPKLFLWDLRELDQPEWILRPSPTTTDFKTLYYTQEEDKYHGKLKVSDAWDISHLLYE